MTRRFLPYTTVFLIVALAIVATPLAAQNQDVSKTNAVIATNIAPPAVPLSVGGATLGGVVERSLCGRILSDVSNASHGGRILSIETVEKKSDTLTVTNTEFSNLRLMVGTSYKFVQSTGRGAVTTSATTDLSGCAVSSKTASSGTQ